MSKIEFIKADIDMHDDAIAYDIVLNKQFTIDEFISYINEEYRYYSTASLYDYNSAEILCKIVFDAYSDTKIIGQYNFIDFNKRMHLMEAKCSIKNNIAHFNLHIVIE